MKIINSYIYNGEKDKQFMLTVINNVKARVCLNLSVKLV